MRVQQLSPPQYMPAIKVRREFTPDEEAEFMIENKRQASLKRGWHAVKSMHVGPNNKCVRTWHVVFYKSKGYYLEGSTLSVGKGKEKYLRQEAETLACLLVVLNAKLEFIKD